MYTSVWVELCVVDVVDDVADRLDGSVHFEVSYIVVSIPTLHIVFRIMGNLVMLSLHCPAGMEG